MSYFKNDESIIVPLEEVWAELNKLKDGEDVVLAYNPETFVEVVGSITEHGTAILYIAEPLMGEASIELADEDSVLILGYYAYEMCCADKDDLYDNWGPTLEEEVYGWALDEVADSGFYDFHNDIATIVEDWASIDIEKMDEVLMECREAIVDIIRNSKNTSISIPSIMTDEDGDWFFTCNPFSHIEE